ncbi:hypothetical protein HYC85_003649 [Camellia sinensis]|uniref:Uncharacterized protein n=1 Tax=Camellia sinensis TaxID=4442 RepID=A0A7J7HWG3_CAMSI|nr:hypothetical protein HYC85_003649 [Camellia sinensis]
MISKAPWFLLPLAWAWTGTAIVTALLSMDTAWQLVWTKEFDSSPVLQKAIICGYHVNKLTWHFNTKTKFRPNEVKRMKIILACVFAFITIGLLLIVYQMGIIG